MRTGRILPLALAAALLAGCGGSGRLSKSAYEQKLQSDGSAIQRSVGALAGNPGSLAQLTREIDRAQASLRRAADDLAQAKAPADAENDNTTLVAALRTIATRLEHVKRAAATNPNVAQQAATALQRSPQIKAAERAIADLKRKGYRVGVLGT